MKYRNTIPLIGIYFTAIFNMYAKIHVQNYSLQYYLEQHTRNYPKPNKTKLMRNTSLSLRFTTEY